MGGNFLTQKDLNARPSIVLSVISTIGPSNLSGRLILVLEMVAEEPPVSREQRLALPRRFAARGLQSARALDSNDSGFRWSD